jgi:hypothetical protein
MVVVVVVVGLEMEMARGDLLRGLVGLAAASPYSAC